MKVNILLLISILFAATNNMLLHGTSSKGLRGIGDTLLFNALVSAVWILILSVLNKFTCISAGSWLWGIVYGSVMSAFLLCKMQAMVTGPVSVTSFIGCSSLLVSTAFGMIYFEESVTFIQVIGVILLIFALFLTTMKGRQSDIKETERVWMIWCILFFLCSGATGIIFKLHQSSADKDNVNQMMIAAAITSMVLFLTISVIVQRKTDKSLPYIAPKIWKFVIACGIVSCGYNRLNISLSGMLPSIVFFPLFNGSVIFLSSLFAAILFHEKITKRQTAGITIGIIALILASGGV